MPEIVYMGIGFASLCSVIGLAVYSYKQKKNKKSK